MRKGQVSLLKDIIAGVVTLLILLAIGAGVYTLLGKGALIGQCQEAVLLYAAGKFLSAGFAEAEAKCKAERPTITVKELDALKTVAGKAIDRYISTNDPAAQYFPRTEVSRYEWALEKLVADEMVTCYNKAWRGVWDLKGDTSLSLLLSDAGDYLCILCSRIKFDQSARDVFAGQEVFIMKPWLDANRKEGKTYTALLTEGVDPLYKVFVDNAWLNISTTQAVVFIAGTKKESGRLTSEAVGSVGIFNYNTLTSDLGWTEWQGFDATGKAAIALVGVVAGTISAPVAVPAMLVTWAAQELGVLPSEIKTSEGKAKCKVIIGD